VLLHMTSEGVIRSFLRAPTIEKAFFFPDDTTVIQESHMIVGKTSA
jgi:hypothetical protein